MRTSADASSQEAVLRVSSAQASSTSGSFAAVAPQRLLKRSNTLSRPKTQQLSQKEKEEDRDVFLKGALAFFNGL